MSILLNIFETLLAIFFLFYVHIFLAIAPKLHIIRIWKNSSIPEHYKKHWQNTKEGDTCLFHAVVA